jgi:hypothetical protein
LEGIEKSITNSRPVWATKGDHVSKEKNPNSNSSTIKDKNANSKMGKGFILTLS